MRSRVSVLNPGFGNPEFPPCDQARRLKRRIEFRMTGGEAFPARLDQPGAFGVTFGKKAKPLEYRAIAEARSIAEKRVVVAVSGCEIDRQAIGNVLDSTAQRRIIQHVDYRAMNVGDQNPALTAPDGPGAEDSVFADMFETEPHAVVPRELSTHRPTRRR